jgi:putative inorganic carbon (HCO3(-)) transporter
MKKPTTPQILLVVAAFLAPIIGGQINTEATQLAPGPVMLLRSLFSGFDTIINELTHSNRLEAAIETPTLSHALLGLIVAASAILTVSKRQVFQVPFLRVTVPLIAFMGWLICTLAFTSFMSVSLVALAEWLTYGIVFYAVVASAGRRSGTYWLLMSLVIGCALVSIKGLFEYGAVRADNPSWRVFSTWENPTSLAGMMAIGLILALGLAIYDEGITSALPWTCALSMGCCIMVTDSRGGILSMLAGMVVLAGFVCFWAAKDQSRIGLVKIASVLLLAIAFGRWVHPTAASTHSAVTETHSPYKLVGQVTQPVVAPTAAAATPAVEQSSEFRILLWKGAVQLMKENPLGYGVGTYRFESAKPGLTTETQLAHNTYLQLGVESGFLGFFAFLVFLGAWLLEVVRGCYMAIRPISILRAGGIVVLAFLLFTIVGVISHVELLPSTKWKMAGACGFGVVWLYVEFFRKAPNLTSGQNVLRAAIIASIICMMADNLLESGLYSFGIGFCVFLVLGLGLVQSADGIAPEYIPRGLRAVTGVGAFLIAIVLLHGGAVETLRARGRYELSIANSTQVGSTDNRNAIQNANEIADKALSLAPFGIDEMDGENWRLKANVVESSFTSATDLKEAASWAPNMRNLRQAGLAMLIEKDYGSAIMYFNKALEEDPNNLLTLPKLRDAYMANGEEDKAIEIAKRTIDVEKTQYFQVRSLPELVPVETYEARAFLAARTADPTQRAALLEQALVGYQQYKTTTVPLIMQMSANDPNQQFGGETLSLAQYKMNSAAIYAKALADAYKFLKRPADQARALQMQQAFATAIPQRAA